MIEVKRNYTHPWSGEPGFDRLDIFAESEEYLGRLVKAGERKFWRLWTRDTKKLKATMYKPCDASAEWTDHNSMLGHDNEAARKLKIGDRVATNYSGFVTMHTVTERQEKASCGSGVLLMVSPVVQKSGGGWMDAAWFRILED